jgi:2-keto-myo-inositol isomerase
MNLCISQATVLSNPFEADPDIFSRGGWTAVEIWLTKLETYLQSHSLAEARALWQATAIKPEAAAAQGGLLLSQGAERAAHWDHFRRRLELLAELSVPTLIVTPDFARQVDADDFPRAADALAQAAALAATFDVRLALEFQKASPLCACLETAVALVAQADALNLGVCFDVFHYYTGPSKLEDLASVPPRYIAWVQLCDISGTPREVAGDSDRIFPGEGDFQLEPIVEYLGRLGYEGSVSLEVTNPHLWRVAPDRVADLGYQALRRVLGKWALSPAGEQGGT